MLLEGRRVCAKHTRDFSYLSRAFSALMFSLYISYMSRSEHTQVCVKDPRRSRDPGQDRQRVGIGYRLRERDRRRVADGPAVVESARRDGVHDRVRGRGRRLRGPPPSLA